MGKLSKTLDQRRLLLYYHTIREPLDSPTRQATFLKRVKPNLGNKKRVGRPKKNWTEMNQRKAWKHFRKLYGPIDPKIKKKHYDHSSKFIQHWLNTAVNLRLFPPPKARSKQSPEEDQSATAAVAQRDQVFIPLPRPPSAQGWIDQRFMDSIRPPSPALQV